MSNENNSVVSAEEKWGAIISEQLPAAHATNTVRQTVQFECSDMMSEMAKLEHNEMLRVMRFTVTDILPSQEDVLRYMKTICHLRVVQVENVSKLKDYSFTRRNLNIPVRLYQIICSLGEAVDRDYGVRFVPAMDIEASDLMSPEELREMSSKLMIISLEGYLVVETGLPNTTEGELGTMACLLMQDEKVFSYRKDHVVYGFIASFFKTQLIKQVFTDDIYRIYYGSMEDFRSSLSRIYRN